MRMMVAVAAALLLGGARPATEPVDYTLAPELDGDAIVALRVTARFAGDRSGTTRFDWADGWAGEQRLGQWARDLTVTGARSVAPAPHGGRIIRAAPGAPLTISYRIVSAFAADPGVDDSEQAKPVVRPGWFYAVGEALFAVPQGRDDAPVRFTWAGPRGIGFASDLEHAHARPGLATKTLDDLTESIVIGGRDLRVTTVTAGGAPLRIATIGRYDFGVPAFEALVQRIVATERRFWRDTDAQPFLVTMTPLVPQPTRVSYGGTGRSDAFALWMDGNADMAGLAWLLAHEYFHTWNARQLGSLGASDAENRAYWLSEGFTDFYARRLMLRAGLLTPEQFAASWNETLAAYAASPFRTATNAAAAKAFWRDEKAEKLPYQRGAMLAALWDLRLRRHHGGSLDAVLRDQRARVAGRTPPPPLATAFAAAARSHGLDIRADVGRYLTRGQALTLPRETFGRCAAVEQVTRPVFERGYDAEATAKAGNVVMGLDLASPAYAAGLRDGMRITGRKGGMPGNSTVDYELTVNDGGVARTITFRPAGRQQEVLQQIVLDRVRFATEPEACRAALAG